MEPLTLHITMFLCLLFLLLIRLLEIGPLNIHYIFNHVCASIYESVQVTTEGVKPLELELQAYMYLPRSHKEKNQVSNLDIIVPESVNSTITFSCFC